MLRQKKNVKICWDEKSKATRWEQTIQISKINPKVLSKEGRLKRYWFRIKEYRQDWTFECGPMLVTEPNVVWLLVIVLVVVSVFVTTTLASGCLLCQILPCPRCVWKIYGGGGWHKSAGSSSDGQVIWVARLSRLFNLCMATGLGEGNSEFKPIKLRIKNWSCVVSCSYRGVMNTYI